VDDYAREIRDLQTEVDQLAEAEAEPATIAELENQIDVLSALYRRARELFSRGESEPDLKRALALRGYGGWTLDNVYAFVYEAAVDEPAANPREFLEAVRHADFANLLLAPLSAS
jgi:hypothetical protein